jgi:hypothetical protein
MWIEESAARNALSEKAGPGWLVGMRDRMNAVGD